MNNCRAAALPMRLSVPDAAAAEALSKAEGWAHDLRDWATMLELGLGVGVPRDDGGFSAVGVLFPHGEHGATVGMIIVSAECRGQGQGRRVMEALFDLAGPERVVWLYATELGAILYRKLGFEESGATLSFRGFLDPEITAPSVRTATGADRAMIAALDLEAFGAARPSLLDRLEANQGILCVSESAGATSGFGLIRGVGSGWQIGPVVAASETEAFGLVVYLAQRARQVQTGWSLRIDVPESAIGFCAALTQAGLKHLPREPLMVRGGGVPGDRSRYFAVASSAYG